LAKASVALVASNNTLCMPQPKEFWPMFFQNRFDLQHLE
jgi:hypothetical protein